MKIIFLIMWFKDVLLKISRDVKIIILTTANRPKWYFKFLIMFKNCIIVMFYMDIGHMRRNDWSPYKLILINYSIIFFLLKYDFSVTFILNLRIRIFNFILHPNSKIKFHPVDILSNRFVRQIQLMREWKI